MTTIQEALSLILQMPVQIQRNTLSLLNATGLRLAGPQQSPFDLPHFDNSAMDGYAVCGLGPRYSIVGKIKAGDTDEHTLSEGEAFRIFTGARIPLHTTAVIMQEKAERGEGWVSIHDDPTPGKNIRARGTQVKQGDWVFEKGQLINPATAGLMASMGFAEVEVALLPRVALITTGDELVPLGTPLKDGQLYESNGITLEAALLQFGFLLHQQVHIGDTPEEATEAIEWLLEEHDVLLLSGGISVGDYDFVKEALTICGVEEVFYKVWQKPGKPLFFGKKGDKYVFALPGNPASSLTCFYIYVLPLLQRMTGTEKVGLPTLMLPLAHAYHFNSDRPSFLKASVENGKVQILDGQGSSMLHSLAVGNALVLIENNQEFVVGDLVACYIISLNA